MSNGEKREAPRDVPSPERSVEREPSKEKEKAPEPARAASSETPAADKARPAVTAPAVSVAASSSAADAELMRVERVLEQNLSDIYIALPPESRKKFKAKGEETARAIRKMIDSARARARHVLHLIRDWLKLIPHVNRYFLEQEAKIKTDVIMGMAEEKKSQGL